MTRVKMSEYLAKFCSIIYWHFYFQGKKEERFGKYKTTTNGHSCSERCGILQPW